MGLLATRRFSSSWLAAFIPEMTLTTPGRFHTQRKAHSAGDQRRGERAQMLSTAGGTLAKAPPRRASMTTTPTLRLSA